MKLIPDIIIAIDGYSSSGKSTLAFDLAKILNYNHYNSGSIYRAIAYYFYKQTNNVINIDENIILTNLQNIKIEFKKNNQGKNLIYLNNKNIEEEIKKPEIALITSILSKNVIIRNFVLKIQRELGKNKRITMDGRDIGTVVFPNAEFKLFVIADIEVRAYRRWLELKQNGIEIDYKRVLKELENRDLEDKTREIAPLKKANDAIVLDNTNMTREQQLLWTINELKKRFQYED